LHTTLTDIELWTAVPDGDREAFSELFYRYYPLLFQYGNKIVPNAVVVEDAIQDLFLDLWQKPNHQQLNSVKAYLLQALKFKLYKSFRVKKVVPIDNTGGEQVFELSPEHIAISKEEGEEQIQKIYAVLEKLSPRQREVIYLKIYKGLSYEEVSEVMGLNYQVVRNLLCTALKSFKKLYAFLLSFLLLLSFLFD
jgi:RNA polymerase sigma factor (sigma-70 family)